MSDSSTEQSTQFDPAAPAEPLTAAPAVDPVDASASTAAVETTPAQSTLAPGAEQFLLPSGVTVVMQPGKGRDLLAAQRVAGTDSHQVMYALAAGLCTFDGVRKVMEDVLDMPLGDVMQLMTKIGGQAGDAFLPSTSAASSSSRP